MPSRTLYTDTETVSMETWGKCHRATDRLTINNVAFVPIVEVRRHLTELNVRGHLTELKLRCHLTELNVQPPQRAEGADKLARNVIRLPSHWAINLPPPPRQSLAPRPSRRTVNHRKATLIWRTFTGSGKGPCEGAMVVHCKR